MLGALLLWVLISCLTLIIILYMYDCDSTESSHGACPVIILCTLRKLLRFANIQGVAENIRK